MKKKNEEQMKQFCDEIYKDYQVIYEESEEQCEVL